MYFTSVASLGDPVLVEQVAALLARCCGEVSNTGALTQPEARGRLKEMSGATGAVICVGREGDDVHAFSLGAMERRTDGAELSIQALGVSSTRRGAGIGAELLDFTIKRAMENGAKGVTILRKGTPDGALSRLLVRRGFQLVPSGVYWRRSLCGA